MRSRWLQLAFFLCVGIFGFAKVSDAEEIVPVPGLLAKKADEKEKSKFSGAVQYQATTDLADELSPRLYEHNFRGSMGYALGGGFAAYGLSNLYYSSLGRAILVEDNAQSVTWDAEVGASKSWLIGRFIGAEHTGRVSTQAYLPVDETIQLEGIRMIPGVSGRLVSNFFDNRLTILNGMSYRYIVNTYDFSPVSRSLNTRDTLSYILDASVNIVGGLSVSVGTGVKLSRKLDSSTEYAYNNSQSISYTWGAFTGEVSHTNGGFTREGDLSLWYVDKYRRIMTGSLTYSF